MTGDEMRAVLTAACDVRWPGAVSNANTVDALLPVVRKIAADELRAAAETVARTPGIKHQATAVTALRARADALDPTS